MSSAENSENSENVYETLQNEQENINTGISAEERDESASSVDYAAVIKADIEELSAEFSELRELRDITELENPLRYAALRDLGLTAAEAYLATTKNRHKRDNRSHLFSMPMVSSSPSVSMPDRDLEAAREIFTDISDAQIRKLYKKVTRQER